MENDAGFSSPDFGGRGSFVFNFTYWPSANWWPVVGLKTSIIK